MQTYPSFSLSKLFSSLCFVAVTGAFTSATTSSAQDYSLGLELGSYGMGIGVSGKSALSDQVQWRLSGGGASFSDSSFDESEAEIDNVSYDRDFDIDVSTIKAGYEWYPMNSGLASNIFIAGGVAYSNEEFSAKSDTDKQQTIGSTTTTPGDGRQIQVDVERTTVLPYASLGWGNRITNGSGFSFRAELGVTKALQDYDVTLKSVGGTSISQADLDAEKRSIEDELEKSNSFFSLGVSYVF